MHVCLYALYWHYLDGFDPLITELKKRNISYDIIIPVPKSDIHYKYKKKYSHRMLESFNVDFIKIQKKYNNIPIFGFLIKTFLLLIYTNKFFKTKKYTHLILTDDRTYNSCVLIKSAKRAKILNIILYPYEGTITVARKQKNRTKQIPTYNLKRKMLMNITKFFYPINFAEFSGKHVYMFTPRMVLKLFLFRMFPDNPWMLGGNTRVNQVAVNTQIQKQDYIKNNMLENRICVTGFPPHDKLRRMIREKNQIKKEVANALGIDNKKIFLIIGTHFFEGMYKKKEMIEANKIFNVIMDIIIRSLDNNYNIIFKVHPVLDLKLQKEMINKSIKNKITFTKGEFHIHKLIAVSDAVLHFASGAANAVFATDSPLLAYNLDLVSFKEICHAYKSNIMIHTPGELKNVLNKLINNKLQNAKFRQRRMEDRKNFGMFDGKNTERFVQLLLDKK
ncbi:CDP-glycerol glycerophosphotransferase family protein [bacterium]|nr:CDP-glycerol glycerophosphotransferase family protein [bacterium]